MQKIRIDFDNPGLPQHISAVENDSQSRFFQATLYENGKAYTAPAGASYSIMYRGFGPQNQGWYDTINDGAGKRAACAVSGNVVTCEIARQALQVPGHVSIVLCVTTGKGYMLKSWPIECDCKNDRYDSTAEIQSFFYITQVSNESWTQAIQAVEELKNTIDPTLSLSGKAADAAKVGEAVNAESERAKGVEGQLKEDLSDIKNDVLYTQYPNNLLDNDDVTPNAIIDDNGNVKKSDDNSITGYIAAKLGDEFWFAFSDNSNPNTLTRTNVVYVAEFDEDNKFILRSIQFPCVDFLYKIENPLTSKIKVVLPNAFFDKPYKMIGLKDTPAVYDPYYKPIIRILTPEYNIKNYGADETHDFGIIANKIISDNPNGCVIMFPAGEYICKTTVKVRPKVTVKGLGRGQAVLYRLSNISMFESAGDSVDTENAEQCMWVEISNFTIRSVNNMTDKAETYFSSPLFKLRGMALCKFSGLSIISNGVHFDMSGVQDSSWYNCHFWNSGKDYTNANLICPSFLLSIDTDVNGIKYRQCNQLEFYNCTWESFLNQVWVSKEGSNDIFFNFCKFESTRCTTSIFRLGYGDLDSRFITSRFNFTKCVITAHSKESVSPLIYAYSLIFSELDISFYMPWKERMYPLVKIATGAVAGCTFDLKGESWHTIDGETVIALADGVYAVESSGSENANVLLAGKNNFCNNFTSSTLKNKRIEIHPPVTSYPKDKQYFWDRGTILYNDACGKSEPIGWICVESGFGGVWRTIN
jgi:hypothetical protein